MRWFNAECCPEQTLKTRLVVSHLILVALMTVVMTWAVINFFRLGRLIDHIVMNNYKNVVAAQKGRRSGWEG